MKHTSHSEAGTKQIAGDIAATARGGDVFLLSGELGAGKTTFSKGFLYYFGIDEHDVVSPTFTLMQVYEIVGAVKYLVHIDTYRMEYSHEFLDIGALDYVGESDVISLIEWPRKIRNHLEGLTTRDIVIERLSETERTIRDASITVF